MDSPAAPSSSRPTFLGRGISQDSPLGFVRLLGLGTSGRCGILPNDDAQPHSPGSPPSVDRPRRNGHPTHRWPGTYAVDFDHPCLRSPSASPPRE